MEQNKLISYFLVGLMIATVFLVWWKVFDYFTTKMVVSVANLSEKRLHITKKDTATLIEDFLKKEKDLNVLLKKVNITAKDPFQPPFQPKKQQVKEAVKPVMPSLVLRGIVLSDRVKLAIIDVGDKAGVIVKEGQKIGDDITVISIKQDKVVVEWKGKTIVLEME